MFGRPIITKRRSEQYGAQYNYNATAKMAKPWTPLMLSIRKRMEAVAGPLDGGLIQVYPTGEVGGVPAMNWCGGIFSEGCENL